jgi:16S rRNA (guanine527-N7)-methyltransferase
MRRLELAAVLKQSQVLGHIGPGNIDEQIEHARAHLDAANPTKGARWCDLGSGGGLPGLVVGYDRPDLRLVLLDRSTARTSFLDQAIIDLGLEQSVDVLNGDAAVIAHQEGHRGTYDGVFSRSFGSPAMTAECAVGLLGVGGRLVVSEPPDPLVKRWEQTVLHSMGFGELEFSVASPRFVSISLVTPTRDELPRSWKKLTKTPMF